MFEAGPFRCECDKTDTRHHRTQPVSGLRFDLRGPPHWIGARQRIQGDQRNPRQPRRSTMPFRTARCRQPVRR